MSLLQLLTAGALVLWACFVFLKPYYSVKARSAKLPPGPRPLPVLGNILQVGQLPHQSFAKLSETYGPIMSLQLGSIYTVIISSSDLAKKLLTKHDLAASSRPIPIVLRVHDHHKYSFGYLPVGTEWRKFRKVSREHLFSLSPLIASEKLREEKVEELRGYVQKCCDDGRAVNVAHALFVTTLNLIWSTLFSADLADFESEAAHETQTIIQGTLRLIGEFNIADFFPILEWMDPQGFRKMSELYIGKMLGHIEKLVRQRMEFRASSPDSPKKNDFLETLLDLGQGKEFNYTVNDINHLFLEFILAGSDTTATATEWTVTELLLNPEKLSKVRQELRTVIGKDGQVQESDFERLPYLQATIKEAFRYHPPAPFLIPHKTDDDIEISGYIVPKGSQILVNVWAMGRDPNIWPNPDTFEPERFLDKEIDFKGQDFNLLPFGSGRRMCPGMPLANRMLPLMVASLIHNFDWKLESNLKPGESETAEKFGLAVHKAVPLTATPLKIA